MIIQYSFDQYSMHHPKIYVVVLPEDIYLDFNENTHLFNLKSIVGD